MTTEEWDEVLKTTSPIDGLNNEEFEKIRDQIIEYIKMYNIDGEAIGAYKSMKLFEPYLKKYNGSEVAEMMKAAHRAGQKLKQIDLKELQSVLHNVQNVMAGYSQDDTWSDYDRDAHKKLIEMQYKVEAEIKNVQPIEKPLCGVGEKNRN